MKESIFKNSLRAFFVALFTACGLVIGLVVALFAFAFLVNYSEEETFSSSVKLMPDANFSRKELPSGTPVILQINIKGEVGKEDLKASKIQSLLLKSREDDFKNDRVKGILLVINSPGGDANDSDIIYRMLKEYKERFKMPIYAYVDGICASGSYYLACAADEIYASPVSLIGSVGVVSWPPFMNVTDLLQKLGVDTKTLSAGLGKDQMNPFRPWKPDEDKNHQALLNFFYNRFVSVVCANRPNLKQEKLVDEYGARVYPASTAKEFGYIDHDQSTLEEAMRALVKAAGLEEDEKYQVVSIESKEWFKKLFSDYSLIKLEMPDLKVKNTVQYIYE
jgi:protease-4